MEYNKLICDMNYNDEVEGFYLLSSAAVKTTNSGKPYLNGLIGDKSGTMELKVWDFNSSIYPEDIGKVVKLRGTVSEYRGSLQFTASKFRFADERDHYDISNLVPVAPIDVEESYKRVQEIAASIEDSDYRRVAELMLQRHGDEFRRIPAAKSVHHSFVSGLLMHTANMLHSADVLADIYSEVIDRSLLLTGTLLHDFAKAREFSFTELGLVSEYSVEGQLLGHLVMGAQEVAAVCDELGVPAEKSLLLQHMILSHHGEPDFGAAVRPLCAEAELLHYIDLIDSRMEIYAETFEEVPEGEFSQRIFALEKRVYHHR